MSEIVRIFLCGAQSTGKTTLVNELLPSMIDIHPYKNVARTVLHEMDLDRDKINHEKHPEIFENLQDRILQRLLEIDNDCQSCGKDYITDRGIDPLVYSCMYLGDDNCLLRSEVIQELIIRWRQSLLFVLMPHEECMTDDGTRMKPEMKESLLFTEKMISLLKKFNIPYKVIHELDRSIRKNLILESIIKVKPQAVKKIN